MQEHAPPYDFSRLTMDERVDLALALWDSIHDEVGKMPLTGAQEAELERRAAAMDAGEMPFSPWDEAKERLLAKVRTLRQ